MSGWRFGPSLVGVEGQSLGRGCFGLVDVTRLVGRCLLRLISAKAKGGLFRLARPVATTNAGLGPAPREDLRPSTRVGESAERGLTVGKKGRVARVGFGCLNQGMEKFIERHADNIIGTLSCFDRILFRDYLPIMSGAAMALYLKSQGVRRETVKAFVL